MSIGARPPMMRIVLLLVVGVLLGGAGGGFWRAQRPAITVDSGAVARITDTLRTAPAGAVLLAGNSHAEIASAAPPSCTALVNAGIGAATARSYADTLDRITEPARLRLGVLLIGNLGGLAARNGSWSYVGRSATLTFGSNFVRP